MASFDYDKAFKNAFPAPAKSPSYDYSAAYSSAFPPKGKLPPYKYESLVKDRKDPEPSFNFIVEIQGMEAARFQSVGGLSAEIELVEYQDGTDLESRKQPGRVKWGNITLKKGYTTDGELWKWCENLMKGELDRRNGSIVLLGDDKTELYRYNFNNGFPIRWSGFQLDANQQGIDLEEMELVVEHIERK